MNQFPLYGSPAQDPYYYTPMFPSMWMVFPVIGIVGILFVVMALVLLAELWWYRKHSTLQTGVARPRRTLVRRFFWYWIGLSALGIAAMFFLFLFAMLIGL